MAIIEFEDARFTYDGQQNALDGVTLNIEQGSFTCVLGGNGSGKSTLAKHVNALLAPDGGQVRVLGADTRAPEQRYFIRSNAGLVFQNPDDQIVASVIEDDVAFGPENLGVPTSELQARVSAALAQVGLQGFQKKETAALSGGQKQRVAIAGVLAMQPEILVLDEASAMLDPRGRAGLARVCRELNEAGLTIVLITHFMEEAAHADRVVVLEAGRVALDGAPGEVLTQVERLQALALDIPFATQMAQALRQAGVAAPLFVNADDLASWLRGKMGALVALPETSGTPDAPNPAMGAQAGVFAGEAASVSACTPVRPQSGAQAGGKASDHAHAQAASVSPTAKILEFHDVSFTYQPTKKGRRARNAVVTEAAPADWGNDPAEYWALQGISLSIARGEFFGIAGHTGSGKSTLIQLANGLLQPTRGIVRAGGRDLSDKRAAVEARRDVGVVFQYPERQLFAATVFDDVAFGPRNLGLAADEVERRVREALQLVHLNLDELRDASPFALSGGQQRRVALAGVLAMRPATLVLDEPAAGLDPHARRSIMRLVCELHDTQGLTVVLVSHDMNDLAALCDRLLVLNRGEMFALGTPAEVFADEQRMKGIGLGVPDTLYLRNRLDADLGAFDGVPAIDELAQRIARAFRSGGPADAPLLYSPSAAQRDAAPGASGTPAVLKRAEAEPPYAPATQMRVPAGCEEAGRGE